MKRYYISWHPSIACVITKCFDSKEERDAFRKMVDCKSAKVQTWES